MKESLELYRKTKALLDYINEEFVYDKMGDAGCGGVDPYRSERFDELIREANRALQECEGKLKGA